MHCPHGRLDFEGANEREGLRGDARRVSALKLKARAAT